MADNKVPLEYATNAQEIWKRMTEKDQYLIYGYIHRIESKFKSIRIPTELFYLFALFYVSLPDWDKKLMQKNISIIKVIDVL